MTERFAYNPLIVEEVYGTGGTLNGAYLGTIQGKNNGAWQADHFGRFLGTFDSKQEASVALAKEATNALIRAEARKESTNV